MSTRQSAASINSFVFCLFDHGYTFEEIAHRLTITPRAARLRYYKHVNRVNRSEQVLMGNLLIVQSQLKLGGLEGKEGNK